MMKMLSFPFTFGWWASELKGYRSCDTTYCFYEYETLPPLHDLAPSFTWLTPVDNVTEHQAASSQYAEVISKYEAKVHQKLDNLAREAEQLGTPLPAAFVQFMSSPELRINIETTLCGLCNLADHIIPCPGFDGAYLVGFLRDYQECVSWSLCLTPNGEHCVMALTMYVAECLPEYLRLALYGDLDILEEQEMTDMMARAQIDTNMSLDIGDISISAPTFEAFIYRFLLEEDITRKLIGIDKAPLTEMQQRYLEHYHTSK